MIEIDKLEALAKKASDPLRPPSAACTHAQRDLGQCGQIILELCAEVRKLKRDNEALKEACDALDIVCEEEEASSLETFQMWRKAQADNAKLRAVVEAAKRAYWAAKNGNVPFEHLDAIGVKLSALAALDKSEGEKK